MNKETTFLPIIDVEFTFDPEPSAQYSMSPENKCRWPRRKVLVPQIREADTNELLKSNMIISMLNEKILRNDIGRLFAVVQFGDDQFKVTQNDIIVVEDAQYFRVGDRIKIEKVSYYVHTYSSISSLESANVEATVVEKTFSETKMHFTMIGGKNVRILKKSKLVVFYTHVDFELDITKKIDNDQLLTKGDVLNKSCTATL
uniref:Large ribosomal subunit protein bL21m n=1 Tax=Romanomermis culicivorax TaxID=13658 RepID=A0A915KXR7_ROMCU